MRIELAYATTLINKAAHGRCQAGACLVLYDWNKAGWTNGHTIAAYGSK